MNLLGTDGNHEAELGNRGLALVMGEARFVTLRAGDGNHELDLVNPRPEAWTHEPGHVNGLATEDIHEGAFASLEARLAIPIAPEEIHEGQLVIHEARLVNDES